MRHSRKVLGLALRSQRWALQHERALSSKAKKVRGNIRGSPVRKPPGTIFAGHTRLWQSSTLASNSASAHLACVRTIANRQQRGSCAGSQGKQF